MYDRGRHIHAGTHRHIIEIAERIHEGMTREEITTWLIDRNFNRETPVDTDIFNASIDLSARLISMSEIGVLPYCFSGRTDIVWEQGSLGDRIHKYFVIPEIVPHSHESKAVLEKSFHGRHLDQIAGIRIIWTSNLADHLRIIDGEVAIFHHASFLKCQKQR